MKTSEELLEHYRDLQDGLVPTQIHGKPVWHTREKPLFKGWAFKNYLLQPFLRITSDWTHLRILDHGCGKAAYMYDKDFIGTTLHEKLGGRIQQFYCYDPGYRAYMHPPSRNSKFNAIISAGVFAAIPERDIDSTLREMHDWCDDDGVCFIKIPTVVRHERCFIGTQQSVYINVQPIEYWLDKLDNVLQRRYYVTFAESSTNQIIHQRYE